MSFKSKCLTTAALAAAFAGTAVTAAAGTLYGGGATLPAAAYTGNSWLTGNAPGVTPPFGPYSQNTTGPFVIRAIGSTTNDFVPLSDVSHWASGDPVTITDGTHKIEGTVKTVATASNHLVIVTTAIDTGSAGQSMLAGATVTSLNSSFSAPGTSLRLSVTGAASPDGTTTAADGSPEAPVDPNSLFGAYGGTSNISYCQTGSGTGRKNLDGANNSTGKCGDYTAGNSPSGFSGASAHPNFAASDAPLSAAEFTTFETNVGNLVGASGSAGPGPYGEPVEIPTVAASIAVAYFNTDTKVTAAQINLAEIDICKIFSGGYVTWNQINPTFANKPIVLVYRSDNSGTSFNFSNHLSKVCPTAVDSTGSTANGVAGFNTSGQFGPSSVTGTYTVTGSEGYAFPAGLVLNQYTGQTTAPASGIYVLPESGNGNIVNGVNATNGAIGYAESEDAVLRAQLSNGVVRYATVSLAPPGVKACGTSTLHVACAPLDPLKNFAPSYRLPVGSVITDAVLNGVGAQPSGTVVNGKTIGPGRPIVQTVTQATASGAFTGYVPSPAGCMLLVDPDQIATPALSSGGDYPTYPIAAVTYLLGYEQGNGANTNDLVSLFSAPYTTALRAGIQSVGNYKNAAGVTVHTGFAYLLNVTGNAGSNGRPQTALQVIAGCINN